MNNLSPTVRTLSEASNRQINVSSAIIFNRPTLLTSLIICLLGWVWTNHAKIIRKINPLAQQKQIKANYSQ